jgi:hypothetical protein
MVGCALIVRTNLKLDPDVRDAAVVDAFFTQLGCTFTTSVRDL